MKRFTDSVAAAMAAKAWMPSLMCSLALPDICGWLETPNETVGKRYRRWSKKWIEPRYTHLIGYPSKSHVFLSAGDLYALRCAILHSGLDDISDQQAGDSLSTFVFVIPKPPAQVHCNQSNDKLQLQIDLFCADICAATAEWAAKITDAEVIARMSGLIKLKSLDQPGGLSF